MGSRGTGLYRGRAARDRLAVMYYGERFNGYTHLVGAVAALGAASALVAIGARKEDFWRIVSFAIYGATLVSLFSVSTLYHCTSGRRKSLYRKLDHCAIYLLIAGSYTPFALVSLNGPWGWTLFGAVWALALVGVVQECCIARGARLTSLGIYLLMGWLALFALEPLFEALSWRGMAWLIASGVVYTGGVVFYLYDHRVRHFHGIWHLCVLAGSALHYAALVQFVA
jgi:hemolysin III